MSRFAEPKNMSQQHAIFFLVGENGSHAAKGQERQRQLWPELPFRGALTQIGSITLVDEERRVNREREHVRGLCEKFHK